MDRQEPSILIIGSERGKRIMRPIEAMVENFMRNPTLIAAVRRDLNNLNCNKFVVRIRGPESIRASIMSMDNDALPSMTRGVRSLLIYCLEYAVAEAERRKEDG